MSDLPDPNPNEPPNQKGGEQADEENRPINQTLSGPLEYYRLVRRNPRYRLYLVSHLCQHVGDWFIRIASLLTLDRLAPGRSSALSILVVIKMVPQIFLSHIGGALADQYDRKNIMRALDSLGAVAVLFFLLAVRLDSLPIFYVVSVIRATIHSLYEPSTQSIVPMLVNDPSSLKRAATLNGMAWAFMLIIGGVIAGDTTAYVGVQVCYVIDSVTYFVSALVISCLKGNYTVVHVPTSPIVASTIVDEGSNRDPGEKQDRRTLYRLRYVCQPVIAFCHMAKELFLYLHNSNFGGLVFLKATGACVWGPSDILNMSFAHIDGNEVSTSKRLGYLFSCLGLGYALGPMMVNSLTNASQPRTLQFACASSFLFMSIGWQVLVVCFRR